MEPHSKSRLGDLGEWTSSANAKGGRKPFDHKKGILKSNWKNSRNLTNPKIRVGIDLGP